MTDRQKVNLALQLSDIYKKVISGREKGYLVTGEIVRMNKLAAGILKQLADNPITPAYLVERAPSIEEEIDIEGAMGYSPDRWYLECLSLIKFTESPMHGLLLAQGIITLSKVVALDVMAECVLSMLESCFASDDERLITQVEDGFIHKWCVKFCKAAKIPAILPDEGPLLSVLKVRIGNDEKLNKLLEYGKRENH